LSSKVGTVGEGLAEVRGELTANNAQMAAMTAQLQGLQQEVARKKNA